MIVPPIEGTGAEGEGLVSASGQKSSEQRNVTKKRMLLFRRKKGRREIECN
jgi:hypothetical protein